MFISNKNLTYCIGKATEIAEQYILTHIGSDDPRRSVDDLLMTCRTYLGKQIELVELKIDRDNTSILGACIQESDRYVITYVKGLNFCWKRFVICKETFHAVLDQDEFKSMDLVGHVAEVTVAFPDLESRPGQPVVAEKMAEISAMEFLFPYKRRLQEIAGHNKENFLAIAEVYKVPQVHVERYLSPNYMEGLKVFSPH